ncbi:MAG: sensor histidine kinase [Cyclobacteriaceae bacterium]
MNLWTTISKWGVTPEMNNSRKRYVILSNRVSVLISCFTLIVALVGVSYFGPINSIKLAFLFIFIFLLPLLINKAGFVNASRVILSAVVSFASLLISVIDKFEYSLLEEFQYFEFRLMLMCASLFPFIIFRLSEKKFWMTALGFNFLCLVLYDPIHNLFHVGYYQLGLTGPNYPFLNFMFVACFFIVAGCTYFLKSSFELFEKENRMLIEKLSIRQQEILNVNTIVDEQRAILAKENVILNRELVDKNNQLTETNEQLIQHNNDLQQFSYTVSHNLRGPVASLLGLLYLTDRSALGEQNEILFDHIQKSVTTLDITIKDLGNIIDIRNTISKVRQKINLEEEINHVLNLLERNIEDGQVKVQTDLHDGMEIYSVKPMLSSILYNLISNAIKYKSEERKPVIRITSRKIGSLVKIEVHDNGLGIDTEKFKEKLFGLYKRFHTHVDGKGLGLFLVKLQAESLGGRVEIESTPGVGSTFCVYISDASNPDHQIIMDKEWGKLYYDAPQDIAMVIWKRALKVDEFSEFFKRCVEFINTQQCPNWIAEIKQGTKAEANDAEYDRARMQFANELKRTSLKRLGYVIALANEPPHFEEYKKQLTDFYQGRIQFFRTIEEAQTWILGETQKEVEMRETA